MGAEVRNGSPKEGEQSSTAVKSVDFEVRSLALNSSSQHCLTLDKQLNSLICKMGIMVVKISQCLAHHKCDICELLSLFLFYPEEMSWLDTTEAPQRGDHGNRGAV